MSILESLRQFFIEKFQMEPQKTLPFICESSVAKLAFLSKYKELTPIEDFPTDEKKQWKAYVHELFPDKSKEFKLDAVKIIYVIGTLTN